MRKYVSTCVLLAVGAAAGHKDYWNVQDPDQLYGPLRVEPFEALGFACKRTAVRLTRATATKEGLADADACLDALLARAPSGAKLGPEYFDVVPLLEVRALQYHAYGGYAVFAAVDPGDAASFATIDSIARNILEGGKPTINFVHIE